MTAAARQVPRIRSPLWYRKSFPEFEAVQSRFECFLIAGIGVFVPGTERGRFADISKQHPDVARIMGMNDGTLQQWTTPFTSFSICLYIKYLCEPINTTIGDGLTEIPIKSRGAAVPLVEEIPHGARFLPPPQLPSTRW